MSQSRLRWHPGSNGSSRSLLCADWCGHRLSVRRVSPIYARQVAALHEALADPATRNEALEITRGLIERVLLRPGEARGSFEVELEGEIAAMIELAQGANNKKAAPGGTAVPEAYRRSVKVVAGARNHRQLTLRV